MMRAIPAFLIACTLAALGAPAKVSAAYPDKPITLVVPFPPGGTTDLLGRTLSARLSQSLGQTIVVENRGGAGGTVGSDIVAKAAPDGYTLLFTGVSHSVSPALYKRLPYDSEKSFTPITTFANVPNVLVVNPALPVKTVAELVAYTKRYPDKVFMGSAGNGTTNHLSGELFRLLTGASMTHVPYKGSGPAMTELLGNQVQMMFDNLPGSLPHLKSGKLRALAVTSSVRSRALPDVPTMREAGVADYTADVWFAVMAPANLPQDVAKRLETEITKIAQDPQMQATLQAAGADPLVSTQAQFIARIKADAAKWGRIVKQSGASVD